MLKKYKYFVFALFLALGFVGFNSSAHAMTSCDFNLTPTTATCFSDTNKIGFYYLDSGSYQLYFSANANQTLQLNPTDIPMLNDPATYPFRIYDIDDACDTFGHYSNTAVPDFCGTQANVVTVTNGNFDMYTINHPAPANYGIALFPATSGLTGNDFVANIATGVHHVMGSNGLALVLAVVLALGVAIMLVFWLIDLFKEAKAKGKKRI